MGIEHPERFELAQIACETGGWSDDIPPSVEQIRAAELRWIDRSYRPEAFQESESGNRYIEHQCGGCHFFAATGSDFGICWNQKSPLDGMVCFEHGGCLEHSERNKHDTSRSDVEGSG